MSTEDEGKALPPPPVEEEDDQTVIQPPRYVPDFSDEDAMPTERLSQEDVDYVVQLDEIEPLPSPDTGLVTMPEARGQPRRDSFDDRYERVSRIGEGGMGEIAVFNRSHYEDVLIVRVLGLTPEERWSRRYRHITDFERLLTDEGTTIVKLYLHISKEEQAKRLQERLDTPHKLWKFNKSDLEHRELWGDYMKAFEVMLAETSTEFAPWYVIPANRKWYRNYVIGNIIVDTLESLEMKFPEPEAGLDDVVIE